MRIFIEPLGNGKFRIMNGPHEGEVIRSADEVHRIVKEGSEMRQERCVQCGAFYDTAPFNGPRCQRCEFKSGSAKGNWAFAGFILLLFVGGALIIWWGA